MIGFARWSRIGLWMLALLSVCAMAGVGTTVVQDRGDPADIAAGDDIESVEVKEEENPNNPSATLFTFTICLKECPPEDANWSLVVHIGGAKFRVTRTTASWYYAVKKKDHIWGTPDGGGLDWSETEFETTDEEGNPVSTTLCCIVVTLDSQALGLPKQGSSKIKVEVWKNPTGAATPSDPTPADTTDGKDDVLWGGKTTNKKP